MTQSSPTFPREYLLRVYEAAVQHGHLLLHPIKQEDAKSFTQSFYRLRRRSDKSNASFILPEYHLVTVGNWRPANGGTLPIFYNTSDEPLPTITPIGASFVADNEPPDPNPTQVSDPDFDADAFVSNLINKSHERKTGTENNDDS